MKNHLYFIVIIVSLFLLASCGKKKEQIQALQAENAKLMENYSERDSLLNDLFVSMNDIERNLSDITAKEKMISDIPEDETRGDDDVRNKIMDEIIMINNIMEENRERIASLKNQLAKSQTKIASLEETIRLLSMRLEEKEMEVAELKAQLVQLNFTLESLNATIDTLRETAESQSKIISQQDEMLDEMNTVWYISGTKKELTEMGIIEKAGGLFSGRMKMTETINPGPFTVADMRTIKSVSFNTGKAELVSIHPEGSFRFVMDGEQMTGLEILNPGEFWKSSRFLVIMTR